MKKYKRLILSAALMSCIIIGTTACKAPAASSGEEKSSEEASNMTGMTGMTEEVTGDIAAEIASGTATEMTEEEKASLEQHAEAALWSTLKAIEIQYPHQTFSDIPGEEMKRLTLSFKDSYILSGRISSDGWSYIAGISKIKENPLEGMTCGTGAGAAGFNTSQFNNGKLILMESSDSEASDLSFLYDLLQQGEIGITYLLEAGERGVSLVPPKNGPFMKVSMVKQGIPVTEFIPLTESQAAELEKGEPVEEAAGNWTGRIAVSSDRAELQEVWNGAQTLPTRQMVSLAEEKSGFEMGTIADLKDFTKAEMQVDIHGELRRETIENRDDLERLTSILTGASYSQAQTFGNYGGVITLTRQDGTVVTVQAAMEGSGYILGNSVCLSLSEEETKEIWSVFSRIDAFRKYGDKIGIRMTEPSYTADSPKLTFTLFNDTGKKIDYILSPVIYKMENDSWKRINSISGFCGVLSPLEGESIPLSMPWKDDYELEGPGTYKVEIQTMPETDLRFEIADTFELVSP